MFTKKDLCECAWREVQKRKDFYPRMVRERKMTQATADDQTEKMQAIYRILAAMPDDGSQNSKDTPDLPPPARF